MPELHQWFQLDIVSEDPSASKTLACGLGAHRVIESGCPDSFQDAYADLRAHHPILRPARLGERGCGLFDKASKACQENAPSLV